jgi:hypothetical protein
LLPHAHKKGLLVVSVAIEERRIIARDQIQKRRKNPCFGLAVVGPKGMVLDVVAIANNKAN